MHWYALDCYVTTLTRSDCCPQTAIDQGRPRKHIGRKKLKTDDDTSVDCKNRGMSCNDEDDADADADNDGSEHTDTKLNGYCFLRVSFASF